MSEDARFEDAGGRPLYLGAMDLDDLAVISALVQDAVLPASEMTWRKGEGRLAFLINRLRREDEIGRGEVERVQSVLVIENVARVASQGVTRGDPDTVLQMLTVSFEPGEDAAGFVEITFAGDGAVRAEVEALEVSLKDVTRPYAAPSGKRPSHPE
ncbi:hypothetical protein OCH239_02545 [Roseivivax halodurans JCM 10272]|uniref:DUF2948 family protein n=1 Tax=Roseivivax halodurans JCM 10272 TaxID=1449350 RepID=X7EEX0_9RHOB|nr:DUF2948 family protein [Roseivivax halodurans]ETX14462.1 hypothetical protein OCH239_02545 [Roseivivax halodurans JCM 10272]